VAYGTYLPTITETAFSATPLYSQVGLRDITPETIFKLFLSFSALPERWKNDFILRVIVVNIFDFTEIINACDSYIEA